MRLPLSAVIVARNEERNLPRCLESVRGIASEILVVLNDTTDGSARVAERAGARVRTLPWRGFRDTKNAAVELAANDWVLCLDADEEVSPALAADIESFFAHRMPDRFAAARFPRKVWFIDRWITHGDWYPDRSLRLFDRRRARWGGDAIVHEKVECDDPVATLKGDLHHYSFPTLTSHVAKIAPFSDLFLKQSQEKGRRFNAAEAVLRPIWRFFRAYILRGGFLDGYPGYYIAVATAFGSFVRYSRLYEAERSEASASQTPYRN